MKTKANIFTVLLVFFNVLIFAQGIVSENGLLKVDGNKIKNDSGEVFKVAGNSIYWSGFNAGIPFYDEINAPLIVNHLADEWDSGLVRAAMAVAEADGTNPYVDVPNFRASLTPNPSAEGYFNNPADELEKVENIIDAAIAKDIYVIVDFHSHFADQFEAEAITFFEHIATKYGGNDHIIYEIYNEPIFNSEINHRSSDPAGPNLEGAIFEGNGPKSITEIEEDTWDQNIKPYAINVINAIRAIDKDNLIIVGTPTFSQAVDIASTEANRIKRSDLSIAADADLNIAYTLHFYAGTHSNGLRSRATTALNNGVALFVTEWGTVDASGNGGIDTSETLNWINFMNDNDISHANWSVVDQNESSAVVLSGFGVQGLLDDNLTASGNLVKCIIENYNAGTSFSECSATTSPSTGIPTCGDGGGVVLTGIGSKVEVETPASIGEFDLCGARSDFRSDGLSVGDFMGQGILTGFTGGSGEMGGETAVHFLNLVQGSDMYTIQVVFSSNGPGNTLNIKTDSGAILLKSVALPDTGGLNNYQIINITGVPISDDNKSIEINVTGPDSVNVESFYYSLDNDFTLSATSFASEIADQINLYPIPVSSSLYIDSPSNFGTVNYSLYDLKGKELRAKTQLINGKIDTQSLSSGLYLIQLYINNQAQTYKFVKK